MSKVESSPPPSPLAVEFARASWLCSVAIFVVAGFGRQLLGKTILIDLLALALAVVGFGLAIAALLGVRRYGRKRILAPALTGLVINGFLLLVWVSNFLGAYARSRAASGKS